MEPAAMLIRALEVEIRRKLQLLSVRALQHRFVRRARIEPDVERILHLLVLRGLGAEQFPCIDALPGLDTALLHFLRDGFEQLRGSWVQGAGLPVDEERHRHTPLALARQRPVGTIGDHSVQARLAPGRIEAGCVHASQRGGAQGLRGLRALVSGHLVHAREPLGRGAVDDRGPVAPAVHIAVRVFFRMKQGARFADLLDDPGIRGPDVQSSEKRQRRSIFSVAHDRSENLLVLHAVAAAGNEIIDAVGRSAVDDARALLQRHVLAEVDGRKSFVERVPEVDQLKSPSGSAMIEHARLSSALQPEAR